MAKSSLPFTHYDLTDLRVFIAVAEESSMSRGAERCHMAPSTASLRLKGLESALGTALLQRQPRGVAPTAAGRLLLEHARQCLAQLEQMHADLAPYTQGLVGHLTLFANHNAISSHLPDDLATFFSLHPGVRITLKERLSSDIAAAVAEGRADLGVVAVDSQHPGLVYLPYRMDQLVLLVPKSGPLGRRKRVSFSNCLEMPFICLQSGAALHTFLLNQAAGLGKTLDVRVQVSGYRAIARLVRSGAGVGVAPRSALQADDLEGVAALELDDAWARREIQVCARPDADKSVPYLRDLIAVLTSHAA